MTGAMRVDSDRATYGVVCSTFGPTPEEQRAHARERELALARMMKLPDDTVIDSDEVFGEPYEP